MLFSCRCRASIVARCLVFVYSSLPCVVLTIIFIETPGISGCERSFDSQCLCVVCCQDGLRVQDRNVVLETLTPLTPSVISRQATINIGTIGHVAHGKSTTVKAVSGVYVSVSPSVLRPHSVSE
jgi:hypothetical protein